MQDTRWRFCVAPMLDWTDSHCRVFHRALSKKARLYTEMITSPALVHGAWLLEGMGRASEALPLWKRVLERYPDATDPAGRPVRDHLTK